MKVISKKICMLGDFAVGKTSLVERYVYNRFGDSYISSIGVKVSRKTIVAPHAGDMVELSMMLWDIAGRNGAHQDILPSYLRGSAGAVLVCDLTRPATLDVLGDYASSLRAYSPKAALVIAANKGDLLDQRRLSDEALGHSAVALGAQLFVTSARAGDEVEQLFRHLGRLLLDNPQA